MSTPVLALNNLRIVIVVIVVAVHAVMAYLGSSPASSFKFDDPPYRWRSMPIVDPERWFGFDFFCGFQDIYLISLLFFLSGLFVWPSLARSGSRIFLRERVSVESYTENPTCWPSRFPSCFSPRSALTTEAIMKRVGIYLKVSTDSQTTENQRWEF
jgi:hypothetical protein